MTGNATTAATTQMRARIKRLRGRLTYGLARKFSLLMVVVLTVFTGALTTVNIVAEQGVIEQRLRQRAQESVTMLARLAGNLTDLRINELRSIVQDLVSQEDVVYAYVLDAEGRLIVDGELGGNRVLDVIADPLGREARARGSGLLVVDQAGVHAAEPVRLAPDKLGTVRLGLSVTQMTRDIAALRNRSLALGLVLLSCSLLVGLPLVRRVTRPLAQLTESAEAASKGQFDRRIAIRTNDELEDLAGAFNRMLEHLNESMDQTRHLAYFDSVTGLPNRGNFKQLLGHALAQSRRYRRRGAVLFLDLDRFKLINDTLGHDAGDRLLNELALRLRECLRDADVVARPGGGASRSTLARLGGDEFTLMLSEIDSQYDAARVAERVLKALDRPFDLDGHEVVIGTSIGIAVFPDDGDDPEIVLKNADVAMYHAKEQGRNNYQFYRRDLGARTVARLTLERDLRDALAGNQFELHYQPQLELASRSVVGLEALLRWQHPRLGLVSPATFIPLAEETRLIVPLGAWVLEAACAQAAAWSEAGLGPLRIAVNLSVLQVLQEDFVEQVAAVLAATGLPAERLELEITETMMMTDAEAMIAKLAEIKRMGVQLAIDDFGTGHSSLSYLKRFPLDRVKIDRSFIRDIASDVDDEAIVTAIVALARSLHFEVVAEGVETEQQVAFLQDQGCDLVQGYLFSPPLAAADLPPWLLDWRRGREVEPLPAQIAG